MTQATFDVQALLAAVAEPTRLRCLMLLAREGELCVCELIRALEIAQPRVSRHLAVMREAGLVHDRRQGIWIHYSLHPQLPDWMRGVIDVLFQGLKDQAPYSEDAVRLKRC